MIKRADRFAVFGAAVFEFGLRHYEDEKLFIRRIDGPALGMGRRWMFRGPFLGSGILSRARNQDDPEDRK